MGTGPALPVPISPFYVPWGVPGCFCDEGSEAPLVGDGGEVGTVGCCC